MGRGGVGRVGEISRQRSFKIVSDVCGYVSEPRRKDGLGSFVGDLRGFPRPAEHALLQPMTWPLPFFGPLSLSGPAEEEVPDEHLSALVPSRHDIQFLFKFAVQPAS